MHGEFDTCLPHPEDLIERKRLNRFVPVTPPVQLPELAGPRFHDVGIDPALGALTPASAAIVQFNRLMPAGHFLHIS